MTVDGSSTDVPRLQVDSSAESDKRDGARWRRPSTSLQGVLRWVYPVATLMLVLVFWELWVRIGDVSPLIMPQASDVLVGAVTHFPALLPDTWITFQEIVLGFVLSVVVGVPLAVAIVSSRVFEQSVYPLLVASQVVPKVALAPLIIIWLGFGMGGKVLIAFLIAFFPVTISSVVGLRSIEIERLYLARSIGASPFQTFFRIRLPTALPSIFSGLKLAAVFSVVGAVIGEFVASDSGLGHVLLAAGSNFNTVTVFVAIIYLTVIGVVIFFLLDLIEHLMLPWHTSRR